jgi:hypothetical protein
MFILFRFSGFLFEFPSWKKNKIGWTIKRLSGFWLFSVWIVRFAFMQPELKIEKNWTFSIFWFRILPCCFFEINSNWFQETNLLTFKHARNAKKNRKPILFGFSSFWWVARFLFVFWWINRSTTHDMTNAWSAPTKNKKLQLKLKLYST